MARIAIDARLWGVKHTGLGRYTEDLVRNILKIDRNKDYTLLVRREDKLAVATLFPGVEIVEAEARHYTIGEQLLIPFLLLRLKPNLVHIPHFNIPVLWPGRMVVTIHDLITHEFRGSKQTTLSPLIYWFKYIAHRFVFWAAVGRARRLIVPTNWAKNELARTYKILPERICVTPEAVDPIYFKRSVPVLARKVLKKYRLEGPYLIYTGNTYEHKNLDRLVRAVKGAKVKLVIACARSVFRERFERDVAELKASGYVRFLGNVSDAELRELYRQAMAFITPSLSEGFGLSGLEAMAAGTVVLSSNASCLPEVYGDFAIFFDPLSVDDIVEKIKLVEKFSEFKRARVVARGVIHARSFSWEKTAKMTLTVYEQALKS